MKTKEEILALYEKLCDMSEDIHKDAETYSTCDRIYDMIEKAYAADKEAFMTVFSLENCLALPDWVLSAVITTYKYHGLLENMMRDFRKYACCRHVDGAGERNIRFRKIMLVNLYSENCSVEQGLALNAADRDEGYHYETPEEARYYYETGILRNLFFEDPEAFMKKLAEEGGEFLYDDFRRRCERREIECSCQKDDFKVIPMTVDNKEIVRIVMPLPKKEGDCFEVYLVISREEYKDEYEDEDEDTFNTSELAFAFAILSPPLEEIQRNLVVCVVMSASFPFFTRTNGLVYNLIHVSGNIEGLKLFKKVAWKTFGDKSSAINMVSYCDNSSGAFVTEFDIEKA